MDSRNAAVEPLPFVPAICTFRKSWCGFPRDANNVSVFARPSLMESVSWPRLRRYWSASSKNIVAQTLASSDQGQIENSICSPPFWEGAGEGRSYGKEKSKLPVCAGFQPARDLVFGYGL